MAVTINVPSQVRTFANLAAFPASGSLKTIYIAEDTNKTYRWTGSVYVEISASAAAATWGAITGTLSSQTDLQNALNAKQATLVSGTNIKTINGSSVLGAGDLVVSGGVTSVTASLPISSSGGATPNITIQQADSGQSGFLDSSDWNHFNNKQDGLISGSNIKTVNGGSIVGSGNLSVGTVTSVTATAPMASTGGATPVLSMDSATTVTDGYLVATDYVKFNNKLSGVHAILPLQSGNSISPVVSGTANSSVGAALNRIIPVPFIPNQTFTTASLSISVAVFTLGANGRILIYSDLNGRPDQKLYESANLDCSTNGIKTALVSFYFIAGQTYWIGTHFSATVNVTGHNQQSLLSIGNTGVTNANNYYLNVAFGSAPTTYGVGILAQGNVPAVFITAA
jgi:hypothetical protein